MSDPIKRDSISSGSPKLLGTKLMSYEKSKERIAALNDSLKNKSLTDLQKEHFEAMKAYEKEKLEDIEKQLAEQKRQIEEEMKHSGLD